MAQHPLLSVTNLSWHSNDKSILTDINLSITAGEIVGVIGPNGAGKTSLLRCIYQGVKEYRGDIQLHQMSLSRQTPMSIAKQIAVVGQFHQPVFNTCVSDVVHMGLLPHKTLFSLDSREDKQKITTALTRTDLLPLANKYFHQLSGGEQQRALIAKAIVQQPQLLILDEPTNHLDVYYQHQILQLVTSLGFTVLMTIHDLNLAANYCQRILVIDHGKLIADDTPMQVYQPELLESVFHLPCSVNVTANQLPQVSFQPQAHCELLENAIASF